MKSPKRDEPTRQGRLEDIPPSPRLDLALAQGQLSILCGCWRTAVSLHEGVPKAIKDACDPPVKETP